MLESSDLKRKYEEGTYKPEIRDFMIDAIESANELRSGLFHSLLVVLATLCLALLCAFWEGSVNPAYNLSLNGTIEILAAFLLMWSTLFELGWGLRTWKGQTLHELIHSFLFRTIFITGSFLLIFALLIK